MNSRGALALIVPSYDLRLDFDASFPNFTVDNVRWAAAETPVPEPSGALILALGLGIAARCRRWIANE